jgi:hypothetical protein
MFLFPSSYFIILSNSLEPDSEALGAHPIILHDTVGSVDGGFSFLCVGAPASSTMPPTRFSNGQVSPIALEKALSHTCAAYIFLWGFLDEIYAA